MLIKFVDVGSPRTSQSEALLARNVVDVGLLKHRNMHFVWRAVALWLHAATNCSP